MVKGTPFPVAGRSPSGVTAKPIGCHGEAHRVSRDALYPVLVAAPLMIHGHEVEAVLFDAGGIFVIPDPHVVSPLLQYYGAAADLDRYHRAHYAGMAATPAAGSGERDWSEYNRA